MNYIDKLVNNFLDEKLRLGKSERTYKTYASTIDTFRGILVQNGLDLIMKTERIREVSAYIEKYANSTKNDSTRNLRLAVISSFYSFTCEKEDCDNPMQYVQRKRNKTVTRAEKKKIK